MAEAEALNTAGNAAFKSGDFATASQLYFEAVKGNGEVAKYRTNLCNALLKNGKPALAVEEAAAAIAVDGTWPKGYYFKALALECLGRFPEALAACEEGLHIHRHNAALEDMRSRLHKHVRSQQKQRQAAARRDMRTVEYRAVVRDDAGHEQSFCFKHQVDSARLARALSDKVEAALIIQEVTTPYYQQMLQAKPWMCAGCQVQHGRQRRATKLFLHATSYLHTTPPLIYDMGPTPACSSQECATYANEMGQQLKAAVMAAVDR